MRAVRATTVLYANANRYEFSLGAAALSALFAAAQNRPLASGGTDPGLCRAGHCVPTADPAFP